MKKLSPEIDILKGIAIALVQLGHAIIIYPIDLNTIPWCNYLHWFVSSVHLPLFFAVSGFCFSFRGWHSHITKKARRLLVPYLTFGLGNALANALFSSFVNKPMSFSGALLALLTGKNVWFLYTMLMLFIVFPPFRAIFEERPRAYYALVLVAVLQLFAFWPGLFNIDRLVLYLFYFALGYTLKNVFRTDPACQARLAAGLRRPAVILFTLPAWLLLVGGQILTETVSFPLHRIISIAAALTGGICILSLVLRRTGTPVMRFLEQVGQASLQLYLFNGYFLTVSRTVLVRVLHVSSPFIIIPVNFAVIFFVAYGFIRLVIKPVRLFRFLTGDA